MACTEPTQIFRSQGSEKTGFGMFNQACRCYDASRSFHLAYPAKQLILNLPIVNSLSNNTLVN